MAPHDVQLFPRNGAGVGSAPFRLKAGQRTMKTMAIWAVVVWAACTSWVLADDWPQWMGLNRDDIWNETGILEKFPAGGPKILWRAPIGAGYAGPAVAGGKVFVLDHLLAQGTEAAKNAFDRSVVPGKERILCLNQANGKTLWMHEYDCPYGISYGSGPRTTPLIADGKVYTLGAEGNLLCLNADKDEVIWSHEFKKELAVTSPMWGFAASPLLDGKKLISLARGPGTTVMAFDKDSGKEIWRALTAAEPGYAPPVIYDLNGKRQLIIWHPEAVNGLDPETGKVYWTQPFKSNNGLSVSMPRATKLADGSDGLFVTAFYNGAMMLKFEKGKEQPEVLWRGEKMSERNTDTLHSIIPTPFIENGYIYGVCSYGQFRCLKAETGERVWESFIPTGGPYEQKEGVRWANAFIIKNGDRFFLPNEKGDLIIAKLSEKGYEEISRAHILEPDNKLPGRPVNWSHPAFSGKCMVARNDHEIVDVFLGK